MRITLPALALIALGAPACAEPADPEAQWRACIDGSDGTNFAWGQCGGAYVEREVAALNADWSRVYPRLPPASKAALLDEQRAWIAFREKACALYGTGDRGREGQALSFPSCVAEVIRARREQLRRYGEGGGD